MCPNCKSLSFKILYTNGGDDNLDNLPHSHLICENCGHNYNMWQVDKKVLKEINKKSGTNYS